MTDAGNLTIRPLVAGDEAAWRGLWQAYLAFYGTTRPPEVFAATFARLTSGSAHEFRGLIAEQGGQPVGLAHYLFHRTCWETGDLCYLQDLYAVPAARGMGVGRALIEAVYAAADAHGAANVYWLTAADNATAQRLYDRMAVKTPFIEYNRTA
ncbi:GNAT family N-acetyltransferase [Fertoebacter nigrum]|uniref:GNAT family N-acetyltransferase n=1 Tax=Fertoeibacter niger TaxID=2656921 RepID=A0A8X8H4L1_9RHOB|nr:GNAT family N-acetyltransferase [Fertoeibacter niger]NUB42826.1 GNAT family N-acetyltransferase [Fertoeibacter niger]